MLLAPTSSLTLGILLILCGSASEGGGACRSLDVDIDQSLAVMTVDGRAMPWMRTIKYNDDDKCVVACIRLLFTSWRDWKLCGVPVYR